MELLNKDSGVWYPTVEDGVITWHRSVSETEPTPANIQGPAPVKGTDYWTAADKAEIVSETVAALPRYGGEAE